MQCVTLSNFKVLFAQHFQLNIDMLCIGSLQHSVILGANGSGKSALAACIAGQGEFLSGERQVITNYAWVSVEQQQALIEAERQKDCADLLDIIPVPSTVEEILFTGLARPYPDVDFFQQVLSIFSLSPILPRPFRALSTGETRKLLLAKALLSKADLLILDEPWDGLDQQAGADLSQLFASLAEQITFVFVLNRLSEVPDYCQQVILMDNGHIQWQTQIHNTLSITLSHIEQLRHMQQTQLSIPERDVERFAPHPLDSSAPLVKLNQAKVCYGDNIVFSHLDWSIEPNQHWQVTGPNGSGKTCLLNLITGDHPQCYVNDIKVFGYQRGSGESIWQIKQYIGYMSNAFHLDYRVSCSLLQVILSGFYDSIGLYQTPTAQQVTLAKQWLALMGFSHVENRAFQQLSFGDQRLALIARSMVKHPALLILDEPCNGLDDINRIKVLTLIELLAREGSTTLLYVNHHQEDVIPSIKHHLCMTDFQA
jgi:molybdate transport system ATP-binding protein